VCFFFFHNVTYVSEIFVCIVFFYCDVLSYEFFLVLGAFPILEFWLFFAYILLCSILLFGAWKIIGAYTFNYREEDDINFASTFQCYYFLTFPTKSQCSIPLIVY